MSKRLLYIFIIGFIILLACHTEKKATVSVYKNEIFNLPTLDSPAVETRIVTKVIKDSVSYVTINLVGDLMCHLPQTLNAKLNNGEYDFNPSFEFVKPILQNADFTIGNLETTFAGTVQSYAGYPAFNSPDAFCSAIKNSGFDFLVTSNNHSMDTREEGLVRTIEVIKKHGLGYTGTFNSQMDRDSIRVLNKNGIKIAVLNYTYGTNGSYPKPDHAYMLNLIDSVEITNDVKSALNKMADIVLVFYHMGTENIQEPTKAQKDAVRFAIQAGAKIVIGAHPHVIGPTEITYSEAVKDSVFVAYSLGNFLSNQYWRYTDAGVIMKLKIEKNHTKQKSICKQVSCTPTWVYRGDGAKKMHIIFPAVWCKDSTKLPSFITETHRQKMAEAHNDTKNILNKYNSAIQLD